MTIDANQFLPADPVRRAALLARIDALYAQLGEEVRATGVTCALSGNCCDFEKVDHRLYATGAEIERAAALLAEPARQAAAAELSPALCPFWINRRCTAREARPLGCRIYFCDPAYEAAHAPQLYERYHRLMAALLAEFGVPYRYTAFVDALRASVASTGGRDVSSQG
ncbi:MAG: hypothetical protein AB7K09_19710 [Planctomycetota bacterium]